MAPAGDVTLPPLSCSPPPSSSQTLAKEQAPEQCARANLLGAVSACAGLPASSEDVSIWSQRDAAIEDEVFSQGRFADVIFSCATSWPSQFSSSPVPVVREEVYGQAVIFAMMSPVLRDRLQGHCMDGAGRCELQRPHAFQLEDKITARGFREVARYVYRLAPKFTAANIPEVSAAARLLRMPELDRAAFQWGLVNLETMASQRGSSPEESMLRHQEQGPLGAIGDALCYFGMMCSNIDAVPIDEVDPFFGTTRFSRAIQWRSALLKAFDGCEIVASPAFLELREGTMLLLLECEEMHSQPSFLWQCCIRWALGRKDRELPLSKRTPGGPAFSFEKLPKKLFVPGARLVTVSSLGPAEDDVDWQRWLLPIAERVRFKDMPAQDFAAQMEAIQPMLPELRQVIYRVRRTPWSGQLIRDVSQRLPDGPLSRALYQMQPP